jgi:uncharacterized Zn finger protein
MNINNFEKQIEKKILDRGYEYYYDGNITEIYNQGDNQFIFQVQGSDDYEVVVQIDENGEVLRSYCDCPYDFGPVCKHQVAAYFKLFEILNSEDTRESVKKEAVKQPSIKEVLNNLSKEDLIDIIIDLAQKDKSLKNSLIFRYSKGNDTQELEKCRKLIDSIVRKYTGREGFITYREAYGFVSEMEELFEKVRDTDDPLLALDIAFLVLNEAIEDFQYADDSNGDIGSLVIETIELIGETAIESDDFDLNIREQIFNKLLVQSDSRIFNGWEDFKVDILRICAEFADIEVLRNKLRVKIENIVNENFGNEYMEYTNESMLQILFDMIEEYGTKDEAEEFIKENLKFTSFRELYIDKYIKDKNYHRVLELALEGEKQDKQYAGLVSKWKKIRYTAYKELSMKEEQKKLAKDILVDGDFEYYNELKELVTGDKVAFYNSLKQELKNAKGWRGIETYLKLIVEENDLDELMEYVKRNPAHIEEYAEMLVDKFKDEVIEIYQTRIKSAASYSSNRRQYKEVCGILKRYKKIAGKKNQEYMINELSTLYKKRPAFIDELSKIK